MDIDVTCPKCDYEFTSEEYEGGECPNCGNMFIFDEQCAEDYSDCWSIILWESSDWKF